MEIVNLQIPAKDLAGTDVGLLKQIALGAAKGLCGIHGKNIIHSDFDLRNVFVDNKFVAKVGDFGLAKEADDKGNAIIPYPPGSYFTMGRAVHPKDNGAPEVPDTFSKASDVYSFGYFLLQLLYGEKEVLNTY